MGEERAPWEPIAVLGAGGRPPRLDEGATREAGPTPPPLPPAPTPAPTPAALTTDSLELERQRLEIERERLALDRARLELDRERAFSSVPSPVPTAPPPEPRRPRTSRHTSRPPGRPADRRPVDRTGALVVVVVCATLSGALVVLAALSRREVATADAERLQRIALEEKRAEVVRAAERELDAARGRQAELARAERERAAQREAMAAKTLREAEARSRPAPTPGPGPAPKPKGDGQDDTWTPEILDLRAEIDQLRLKAETGRPVEVSAALRRLDEIAAHPLAASGPVAGVLRPLRQESEAIRTKCHEATLSGARRLADKGRLEEAIDEAGLLELLHIDHPTVALEIAEWRAMRRVQEAREAAVAARRPRAPAPSPPVEPIPAAVVTELRTEAEVRVTRFYGLRLLENLKCKICRGSRSMDCPGCDDGTEPDGACDARGFTRCLKCQGRGQFLFMNAWANCPNCKAQGWIACESCKTTGRVECSTCRGTRSVPCRASCSGTGVDNQTMLGLVSMLAKPAQREVGDWGRLAEEWPERARPLLGPTLVVAAATLVSVDVLADRVVTTARVTWGDGSESAHVLVWVRERKGDALTIRGEQPLRTAPLR